MSRVIAMLAVPLLLAGAGCTVTDPLLREGLWHPTGANEANLALMVASPSDLVQGVAAPGADGHAAARAVQRLRQDRVRPLPDSAISKLVPVSAAPTAPAIAVEGGE